MDSPKKKTTSPKKNTASQGEDAATPEKDLLSSDKKVDTPEESGQPNKKKWYLQAFNKAWLKEPDLKDWIVQDAKDTFKSSCRFCKCTFKSPNKSALFRHAKTSAHQNSVKIGRPTRPVVKKSGRKSIPRSLLTDPELADWLCQIPNDETRVWCRYCACRLTPGSRFLRKHGQSGKHVRNRQNSPQPPPADAEVPPAGYSVVVVDSAYSGADDDDFSDSGHGLHVISRGKERDTSPPVECDFAGRITESIGIGNRKVGFIGAGQIAQAIAQGLLEQSLVLPSDIVVSAPTQRNLAQWRRWKCSVASSNDELLSDADIIFLAVKTSVLGGMISRLAPVADGKTRLVISVVPGVPRERLLELLSERIRAPEQLPPPEGGDAPLLDVTSSNLHVVRIAPNKMMAIGAGFCAYCTGEDLPHALYLVIETMFSALGRCVKVDEESMNAYSTILSSGAAFTCAFLEAMVQGGVNQNLSWDEAYVAVSNVVLGTSQLLVRSGMEPAVLRKAIATPGGSTVSALGELQRGGLDHFVMSALDVGCTKTEEAGEKV